MLWSLEIKRLKYSGLTINDQLDVNNLLLLNLLSQRTSSSTNNIQNKRIWGVLVFRENIIINCNIGGLKTNRKYIFVDCWNIYFITFRFWELWYKLSRKTKRIYQDRLFEIKELIRAKENVSLRKMSLKAFNILC